MYSERLLLYRGTSLIRKIRPPRITGIGLLKGPIGGGVHMGIGLLNGPTGWGVHMGEVPMYREYNDVLSN